MHDDHRDGVARRGKSRAPEPGDDGRGDADGYRHAHRRRQGEDHRGEEERSDHHPLPGGQQERLRGAQRRHQKGLEVHFVSTYDECTSTRSRGTTPEARERDDERATPRANHSLRISSPEVIRYRVSSVSRRARPPRSSSRSSRSESRAPFFFCSRANHLHVDRRASTASLPPLRRLGRRRGTRARRSRLLLRRLFHPFHDPERGLGFGFILAALRPPRTTSLADAARHPGGRRVVHLDAFRGSARRLREDGRSARAVVFARRSRAPPRAGTSRDARFVSAHAICASARASQCTASTRHESVALSSNAASLVSRARTSAAITLRDLTAGDAVGRGGEPRDRCLSEVSEVGVSRREPGGRRRRARLGRRGARRRRPPRGAVRDDGGLGPVVQRVHRGESGGDGGPWKPLGEVEQLDPLELELPRARGQGDARSRAPRATRASAGDRGRRGRVVVARVAAAEHVVVEADAA